MKRYEDYLYSANTEVQHAFLEGWRRAVTLFRTSSPNDYWKIWGILSDEHIMALLANADREIEQQRLSDCTVILDTVIAEGPNRIREFLMNVNFLNEYGVQIESANTEIESEDVMYRPIEGRSQSPWLGKLSGVNLPLPTSSTPEGDAFRKTAGKEPDIDNPNLVVFPKTNGHALRVASNDEYFVKSLIARDLAQANHDCALRYLVASLPGNALHRYAEYVCEVFAANPHLGIDPMMITYMLSKHVMRPEHIFLNYLLAFMRSVKKEHLMYYGHRMATFWAYLAAATDNTDEANETLSWLFPDEALFSFISITGKPLAAYLKTEDTEKLSIDETRKRLKTHLIRSAAIKIAKLCEQLQYAPAILSLQSNSQATEDIYDFACLAIYQTTSSSGMYKSEYDFHTLSKAMSDKTERRRIADNALARYDVKLPIKSTLLEE